MDIMFNQLPGNKQLYFCIILKLKYLEQFKTAFNYIRALDFFEEPDYDFLISIFMLPMDQRSLKNYSSTEAAQIVTVEEISQITEVEKKLDYYKS